MTTAGGVERKVWTEAELEALPEDGYNHEVVDGELVMSPKNNPYHGDICADLSMALRAFAKARQLGAVWDSSTGFWMDNRNCRAPDLAVEILSPNNTRKEIDERLKDFFASGTQITWIINPDTECVEVCYALNRRKLVGSGADLDGEHVLPGFRYPIADLFKGWDWE